MGFNKFQRYKKDKNKSSVDEQEMRVRLPKKSENELFAQVEQLNGGKRMTVRCSDGKIRMARIPGKLKRVYVRTDDYVIIKPWEIEGDKKANIIWKYRKVQEEWLRDRGYLNF